MAEEVGRRLVLEGAVVSIHEVRKGEGGESLIHIDIDHPDLGEIVLQRESTYAGGRVGGLFVGLRPSQAERASEFLTGRL